MTDSVHAWIAAGAAVFVGAILAVRWAITPIRDTGPYSDGHDTVTTPIADLMGVWPQPPMGAVVAQAWRWCAECMRQESSLLHADDCWQCGHCRGVTYAGGAAS